MLRRTFLILLCLLLFTPAIGCAGKKATESEEPFGEHLAFDFGELETLDLDNDGYEDKFTYTFEKEEVAEDLFMQRTVEYEETEAGFMGELTLEFENTGDETKTYSHIEIIPKSFAESVDDLEFSIPPDEIINPDPIVRWEVAIIKHTIVKLVAKAKKAAEKVGEEAAMEAAAPGVGETVGTLFDELGKALAGKKADLDKVAAQARATGKAAVEAGTKSGMEAAIDTIFGNLDDFAFIAAVNKCGQQKDSKVKDKCVLQLLARFGDKFEECIVWAGTAKFCHEFIENDDYYAPCVVLAEDNINICDQLKDKDDRTNCKWEVITAKCCASCDEPTLEECAINKIVELGDESLCERFQDKDVREFCLMMLGKEPKEPLGLSIVKPEETMRPGKSYCFKAECKHGVLPESPYFEWDFGDDEGSLGIPFHNEVTHMFKQEGKYNVTVDLYEEEGGKWLASDTETVIVGKVDITETDLITIYLGTPAYQKNVEGPVPRRWQFGGDFGPDQWKGLLNWDGTSFSYVFTSDEGVQVFREEVKGSVTEKDGKFFVSLYAFQQAELKSDGSIQDMVNLGLKNVPLTPITLGPYPTSFEFDLTGTGVKEYVEAMGHVNFKSAVWTDESILKISFVKVWEE